MTREEAIELLENLKVCRQAHTLFNIEKEAVDMAIEALQENESLARTVNEASELLRKKRPHGEWIDLSDGWQEGTFRCSSCQMEFVLLEGTPEDNEYNFCPNCGASMKKEGDEE